MLRKIFKKEKYFPNSVLTTKSLLLRAKSVHLINTQHFPQSCMCFKASESHLYSISNTLSNLKNSLRANQPLISWTTFDERLINKNYTSNLSHFASGFILGKSCVARGGLMFFCYFGTRVKDHPLPQRRSLSPPFTRPCAVVVHELYLNVLILLLFLL